MGSIILLAGSHHFSFLAAAVHAALLAFFSVYAVLHALRLDTGYSIV